MKTLLFTYFTLMSCLALSAQPLAIPNRHQHTHDHHSAHHHDHGHNHFGHKHSHKHKHAQYDYEDPQVLKKTTGIAFVKNQNQWHENVVYKAGLGGMNTIFLEQKGFSYIFVNPEDVSELHEIQHQENAELNMRMHAYKVLFQNANEVRFEEEGRRKEYHNYFLGNDESKWATEVPLFEKIKYKKLYAGIDLEVYNIKGNMKYDFVVAPYADPNLIKMTYEGADAVEIDNSNLIIHTSVETITEQKPYAYQMLNGKQVQVDCEYELSGNTVSFEFPNGYDRNRTLVIDPIVVASTLSGMTSTYAFGHSATYDNQGNIYAGGRAFGIGYQTTSGAFEQSYGGGDSDIAVTKYNPNGTAQVYATYIGGNNADAPHSMITDFNGQLYILGSSNSVDYPVTNNAFQTTLGGSYDIVVTKLNAAGSALVGSTFMGGESMDGINTSVLNSNYDDRFRGEIVLDQQGNAYIASSTTSDNFPVTAGAYDTQKNQIGNNSQDATVFKLNNTLSTLFWSTYLGGDDADAGFGLRVDDFGNVYVTGIAGAPNFPTTPGVVEPNWMGGEEDAFITIINPSGSNLVASTFWGSSGDEHSFFLDIDENDNVHIYGQTTGTMPITPNTYSHNSGSWQFLSSFNSDLTSLVYSTVIGNGGGGYDFVPVAFMVDKCNNIYFSGYYANFGLPTTPNAISTFGGSVYLGVLDPFATDLQFGTYYGNADHVDGGTSRFDKSGTVYQGVCSCTNQNRVLNTLPGAFSENQITFCDIGVFKIDFEIPTVTAAAVAMPATSGCAPFTVNFQYTGQDATIFEWHFDDNGATANSINPNHTFTEPGTYEVMLIATNEFTCNSVDTSFLVIDVLESASTLTDTTICNPDETIFLDATTTNATYTWQDGSTGSTFSATGPGVYYVDVSLLNGLCTRRDSFIVELNNSLSLNLGPDFSLCDESSFTLDATTPGAVSYVWNNGSTNPTLQISNTGTYSVIAYDSDGCAISDDVTVIFSTVPIFDLGPDTTLCDLHTIDLEPGYPSATYTWQDGSTNSVFTVSDPGVYWVEVNNQGCLGYDTIEVSYLAEVFLEINSYDVDCYLDCDGSIDVDISGGNGQLNFLWNTGSTEPDLEDLCAGDYNLTITDDLCNYELSAISIVQPDLLEFEYDFIDVVCAGDGTGLINLTSILGGTPPYLTSINGEPFADQTIFSNLDGGDYEIVLSDANGCTASEVINIYEPPFITISAGPDQTIELGEDVELEGFVFPTTNQNIAWSPTDSLDCVNCIEPLVDPTSTTLYTLTVTDSITGCVLQDDVLVRVEKNRNVFIPNVFTPNGDGINDIFTIFTGNGVRSIRNFQIFNRWGALVYADDDIYPKAQDFGWDGTFKGKEMNNAVFAWYAEVEFLDDEVIIYKGDVTLAK